MKSTLMIVFGAVIIGWIAVLLLGIVGNPDNWITKEQKQCEQMGGLFIQNSFSKDCIFKP